MRPLLVGLIALMIAGWLWAQDGPQRTFANQLLRVDANGYLLAVNGQYTGPDGPQRNGANQLIRVDANGYLLIAFANGLAVDDWFRLRTTNTAAPAGTDCDAAAETGRLHWDSTADAFRLCSGASGWIVASPGGGAAPVGAQYLVSTADATLTAEESIGALTTGLLLNTVSGVDGTLSAYAGTSCTNQFPRSLNASGAATCATVAAADVSGIATISGTPANNQVAVWTSATAIEGDANLTYSAGTLTSAAASAILDFSSATGVKRINTGGTTDLALMPGRNVGILTTTPTAPLQVNTAAAANTSGNQVLFVGASYDTAGTGAYLSLGTLAGAELGRLYSVTESASNIGLSLWTLNTTLSEKVRVSAAGNLGLSTTTPDSTGHIIGGLWVEAADGGVAAAAGTIHAGASYHLGSTLFVSATAPTVSGFGTSPSVPNSNGTAAFSIDVGTGGTASTGTITLPAATTAWVVSCYDVTTPASYITHQTGGTTTTAAVTNYSRTTGLATAWTASDILRCHAAAY